MNLIRIVSFVLLCLFGISFVFKLIILSKKNNINADVYGKGEKPKDTLIIERCLKISSFIAFGIWIINILFYDFVYSCFIQLYNSCSLSIFGLIITFIGVLFFILAMLFMKTSWRVGIDKSTKTSLVTAGVYKFSRNPAFVGMDLMFIGTAISYANLVTMFVVILLLIFLHLQILQEEKHMIEMFKKEYDEYAQKTPRYLFF